MFLNLLWLVSQCVSKNVLKASMLLFISFPSIGQELIKIDSIKENEIPVTIGLMDSLTNNNGVIFFCTKDYSNEQYKYQASLFDHNKIGAGNNVSINFILFKEFDNISKNPFISDYGIKDSIISQIECYIIIYDSVKLFRAVNIYSQNFYIKNSKIEIGIYQIGFKGICPKDLTYSISLYYDLIYEIFNPNYTTEERLSHLEIENRELRNELRIIKEEWENYKKQNSQPVEKIILEVEEKKFKRRQ